MAIYRPCGQCEICFDFCRCEPIRQKNDYTCGPVAIRNACWVLGTKIPNVNKIAKMCGTDIDGTSVVGLRRGAKFAGLDLKRVFVSSLNDLNRLIIHNNTPLVIGYVVGGEGHYCVVFKNEDGDWFALNWANDASIAFTSHSHLMPCASITFEWLSSKLLTFGTEIYIASKGEMICP
jgi:hypothetical protein